MVIKEREKNTVGVIKTCRGVGENAQTSSMENWKKGGMGNYAVVTEPITSLCERRLL